ncbi:homeobox domain-containing protein [Drepanopeziza brunnea f. sp. 'multigermtubi' MB_m1]|uniref:Homeobox domain-containing protein n=1 Tax=Marssonina brunnea f. sp. multigermtubi (strain MB_m1) TaxID=1072389 RepID=K1WIU1_MARBU|nr:homeobox domain-containing protein [Drepanopeziza brunnea f. sp. 'multigermtubi' MB_m1]EKD17560.1 homeobox domain-containing protein [Drepanopeziza brunnea f. sp. 'multigermtubi' MB_m1]
MHPLTAVVDPSLPGNSRRSSARPQAEAVGAMESPQSRYPPERRWDSALRRETRSPPRHLAGPGALLDRRHPEATSVPRSEYRAHAEPAQPHPSPMQLPSIRELNLPKSLSNIPEEYRAEFGSPTSDSKRRRLDGEEEGEEGGRARYSPRRSPSIMSRPRSTSAPDYRRPSGSYPSPDIWSNQATRSSQVPTLPSISALSNTPTPYNTNYSEYSFGGPQVSTYSHYPPVPRVAHDMQAQHPVPRVAHDMQAQHPSFGYGYQQIGGQSYSGPPSYSHGQDRTPFSSGPFSSGHNIHMGNMIPYSSDGQDRAGDNRPRKRRGNLPKETTDILRAWFMSHLQHPYPSEDEKQSLMRQTGLAMNQISNWFINARRRQLPAMISNARAEADARSARSGEGRATAAAPFFDCEAEGERESERDTSPYDDGFVEIRGFASQGNGGRGTGDL